MPATWPRRRRCCGSATRCWPNTAVITSIWSSPTPAPAGPPASSTIRGSSGSGPSPSTGGTYYCARAFLPLLIASGDGVLVNTSSVNGFWAALGPGMPNHAYSTAKFAVRGFSEALIEDLRTNAPQVRVVLVLPGHVGTNILANSTRALGKPDPEHMSDAQLEEMIPPDVQAKLIEAGLLAKGASADDVRRMIAKFWTDFRDKAPLSAA